MLKRVLPLAFAVLLAVPALAQSTFPAKSERCREVVGDSAAARNAALSFCEKGVVPGTVTGVIAMDSLLFVKATRAFVDALRADHIQAEQLIKVWMRGWKAESGHRSVTVTIELGDVEIATGQTTLLSGDVVTFHH